MNELLAYLLKFSISLSLVTIFYSVFLRRLTFYNWNRWYLLLYPVACFFLPMLDIGWWMESEKADLTALKQLPALGSWKPVETVSDEGSIGFWPVVMLVVLVGSAAMGIRLLLQWLSFRRLSGKAVLVGGEDMKLYAVDETIIPFSFGRSVFVNPALHSEADLKDIILHEMVHVRQHHTADMMLGELLLVLNWFNPFAWSLRNAIRQNLEFIADRQVLTHGVDRREYQYLLVKVVGQRNFSMASHLNFSALKTRIMMMNKIRSTRIHLVKFAFVVPLAAILLLAFRKKQEAVPAAAFEPVLLRLVDDGLEPASEKTPEVLQGVYGQAATDTVPNATKTWTAGPTDKGYTYKVRESNGTGQVTILDKKKKIVKTMTLVEWENNQASLEKQYGELPPPPPPPPAPPAPPAPAVKSAPRAPAPPAPATSVSPVAPAAPIAPVAPAKNGTVTILDGAVKEEQNTRITASSFRIQGTVDGTSPLYFVDGKEWAQDDISLIDPNRIKAVNVLKGNSATSVYGERAKEGVILIETKKKDAQEPVTVIGYAKPSGNPPLYIVNGKEWTAEAFKKVKPENIESITVWKDKKAIEKYGEKGRNGVLVVELKKQ